MVLLIHTAPFSYEDGADFTSFTGRQLTISENGTGCVSVQVRDDSTTEAPEQFFVTLSAPFGSGITIQQPSQATVTILDDDGMYKNSNLLHGIFSDLTYFLHLTYHMNKWMQSQFLGLHEQNTQLLKVAVCL